MIIFWLMCYFQISWFLSFSVSVIRGFVEFRVLSIILIYLVLIRNWAFKFLIFMSRREVLHHHNRQVSRIQDYMIIVIYFETIFKWAWWDGRIKSSQLSWMFYLYWELFVIIRVWNIFNSLQKSFSIALL